MPKADNKFNLQTFLPRATLGIVGKTLAVKYNIEGLKEKTTQISEVGKGIEKEIVQIIIPVLKSDSYIETNFNILNNILTFSQSQVNEMMLQNLQLEKSVQEIAKIDLEGYEKLKHIISQRTDFNICRIDLNSHQIFLLSIEPRSQAYTRVF